MFSLNHRRIFPLIATLVIGHWTLVLPVARAQPANVQADPTTGALTRPTTATFVSGNSLLTPTSTSTLTNKSISGATNTLTAIPLTTAVTGTLPVANGGTGVTSSTGTGSVVLSASPTLTGTIGAASLTLSSLTSGRVPFATTAGLLTDASTLTFSAGTLTASAYIGASLTAPASTALTLTGGSTGASLVLGQGSTDSTALTANVNLYLQKAAASSVVFRNNAAGSYTESMRIAGTTGNLLIGTTTDMTGSGGLKVASTSGSTGSTSGAIITPGGIYAGAASVFGGTITSSSYIRTTGTYGFQIGELSGHQRIIYGNVADTFQFLTAANGAASLSAGAATFAGAVSVSGTAATWTSGTGSPESVKTAPVGSLYTRTDGGASTTLYVKESGAGNTGWIAK